MVSLVHGNEEVDKHAKLASEGHHNNSPVARLPRYLRHPTLPLSISDSKESKSKNTAERCKHLWRTSSRFYHVAPLICACPHEVYVHFDLTCLCLSTLAVSSALTLALTSTLARTFSLVALHSRSHLLLSFGLSFMALTRSTQYPWTRTCTHTRAIAYPHFLRQTLRQLPKTSHQLVHLPTHRTYST
ncbi:hypothetical protein BDR06DRAFT_1008882 [Suillus hirtellus]|nr:hypothetical protein BDR06DRAFT_1008882 [Suillus hirtellus]